MSTELLSDKKFYKKLNKNPLLTIQTKINTLIKKICDNKLISKEIAKELTTYSSTIAKYYGTVKIHKPNLALRPIISNIDSPIDKISKFITDILTTAFVPTYSIKDTFQFVEKVRGVKLPDNYEIISLDVKNLFTNIPRDHILQVLENKWDNIELYTTLNKEMFIQLVSLMMDSCIFTYDGEIYKQIFGVPMGCKASPILSAYALDALFHSCVQLLKFEIPFLFVYVDDCISACPKDKKSEMLGILNSYNTNIQFTMEQEDESQSIPFLDTKVIRNVDNTIELTWYQKDSNSNKYIHFDSYHTIQAKINTVVCMKYRINKICDEKYIRDNLNKLVHIFLNNGFPRKLLNTLIFSTPNPDIKKQKTTEENNYIGIPHIPIISDIFKKIIRSELDEKIAIRNLQTSKNIYSRLKDKTNVFQTKNVVYAIPCSCGLKYYGQTSQTVKQRVTQHISDESKENKSCMLAKHIRQTNHLVLYDNTEVIVGEKNTKKRLILEMIHIQKNIEQAINSKTDTANLSSTYSYLIEMC